MDGEIRGVGVCTLVEVVQYDIGDVRMVYGHIVLLLG